MNRQVRPKLAAYFRVSSLTQKNEETIHRQIENFHSAWERLRGEYDLVERFVFLDQSQNENRFFVDQGYNLETWSQDTACHDLMSRCRRGEIQAIFVSELDRLCRSRSAELRGRIKDTLEAHEVKISVMSVPKERNCYRGNGSCAQASSRKS